MSAAALKAFGTVELLEHILYHSSCRDIVVLQRVSASWRDVINSSSKLQRRLFLASAEKPLTYRGWFLHHRIPTLTTRERINLDDMLSEHELEDDFLAWADSEDGIIEFEQNNSPEDRARAAGIQWPKSINPMLPTIFKPCKDYNGVAFTVDRKKTKDRKQWKSMFLTEPPVTSIYTALIPEYLKLEEEGLTAEEEAESYVNRAEEYFENSAELVENASGITLGDLLESMDRKYGEDVETFYFIRLISSKIQTTEGKWIWSPGMDGDSRQFE